MATFSYTARDRQGQSISGSIEASSEMAAADLLLKRSQIPIKIQLQEEKPVREAIVWPWQRVSMTELIIFSRQMYSLMKAGIPIIRAIVGLAESTSSKA